MSEVPGARKNGGVATAPALPDKEQYIKKINRYHLSALSQDWKKKTSLWMNNTRDEAAFQSCDKKGGCFASFMAFCSNPELAPLVMTAF